MNCGLWRNSLMELARGRLSDSTERNSAMAHVSECRDCRLFLEEQKALTAVMAEVSTATTMAPPADLESIVLSEFRRVRSLGHRDLKLASAILAAAAALSGIAVIQRRHVTPPRPGKPVRALIAETTTIPPAIGTAVISVRKPVRPRKAPKPAVDSAPFVAIPYTLPLDPLERVTIMRMELPVAALMAVGLAASIPDPGASAQADVVVGEDGRIRAIRLVSFNSSAFNPDRRINQ